jgi:DNA-binding Lrp family transcriptional regulator
MWHSMDLTTAIMREMSSSPSQWNVRRSYVDVARKLGVDEETVRNRLKMMKEMGLLRGWRLIPNANVLGMKSSNVLLDFPSPEAKEEAIAKIRKVQGAVLIQDFYGETLQVAIFTREDEDPERSLTSHGVKAEVVTSWRVKLPSSEHRPKEIDWRIMAMMLRNVEKKLPEIAAALKVSTRTVKRRVNMMVGSSVFFMQPLLDLRKAMGVTPCHLLIECAPSEKKRRVDELVASRFERIVFRLTNSDTHSIFLMLCMNIGEMKEILSWARAQEGVELARTDILEQQEYVHEWLEREVIARAERAGSSGGPSGREGFPPPHRNHGMAPRPLSKNTLSARHHLRYRALI